MSKRKGNGMSIVCPNCKGKNIGKIGTNQYFCWDCLIELSVKGDHLSVYEIEEDGTLSSLDDLFTEEEMRIEPAAGNSA